jgi:hypothetical protein
MLLFKHWRIVRPVMEAPMMTWFIFQFSHSDVSISSRAKTCQACSLGKTPPAPGPVHFLNSGVNKIIISSTEMEDTPK